ncbi:MAG: Crp/Fnr family transcriptional regulator [Pseudomonadota bacterium]
MLVSKSMPAQNSLLVALPYDDRQHFIEHCEQVELSINDILCEPGEPIRYVYFPTDSVISLLARVDDHSSLEVGLVGNEGMLGIPLMLGVEVSSLQFVVQGSGSAWRMDATTFRRALQRSPGLKLELNRYLYVLTSQLAQSAACNRFHVVEARLARWLLMIRDRVHSDQFHVTHQVLAYVLGVRRVGITKAASSLQRKKLISYSRGNVKILDGKGLEAASCRCYQTDKDTYERLLG